MLRYFRPVRNLRVYLKPNVARNFPPPSFFGARFRKSLQWARGSSSKVESSMNRVLDASCNNTPEEVEIENVKTEGNLLLAKYNCSGCGAILQSVNPGRRGYIAKEKMDEWLQLVDNPTEVIVQEQAEVIEKLERRKAKRLEEGRDEMMEGSEEEADYDSDIDDFFPEEADKDEMSKMALDDDGNDSSRLASLTCTRCFSLHNYNSALNITLKKDDYLRHLTSLKDKQPLIVLVLDIVDFPSCIFPDLKNVISDRSCVLIVANKTDLFPKDLSMGFWNGFKDYIISECVASGLDKSMIVGLRFVSAKKGTGVEALSKEVVRKWGNRGDVYLLGCTNVGKSSLFNKLLTQLCGSRPGELNTENNMLAPRATISLWPGTTLGLLSFPLMSIGKRRRIHMQQKLRNEKRALGLLVPDENEVDDAFMSSVEDHGRYDGHGDGSEKDFQAVDPEQLLDDLDLRRRRVPIITEKNKRPRDRFWLHDTPGAINDAQLINHLTTKELTLGLPKVPIKPKTYILKPGQSLFLSGLARLDYEEGTDSAYFTVFTWSFINIHATKLSYADQLYERHLEAPDSMFKLPMHDEPRTAPFPPMKSQSFSVVGTSWKQSAADVVLSSAGWVAVTIGPDHNMVLKAHTPDGKGIYIRQPALFGEAVNKRGKRERYGSRTAYRDLPKKRRRKMT